MVQERARLFDGEAERYDRTRPSYPDALIDAVLGAHPRGLSVLDVACGTGIASRQLTARGAQVRGVELNPRMAAVARRHGIDTEVAAFEDWDPQGRTFDLVTCAQAWHWLDPDVSVPKAASLLRPNGRLCVFWSIGRYPDDVADALRAVCGRVGSSDAAFDTGPVVDRLQAESRLGEAEVTSYPWTRRYSTEQWIDELGSHSDYAALPEDVRLELFAAIRGTLDRYGGTFDMPYVSVLISAQRA